MGLNLLPVAGQVRRMDPARKLNAALAAIAVVCLFGALVMTLHNRNARLEDFKREVAAANDAARQARLVRNQLQTSAAAAGFLAQQRAARPTMLEVLADLTRRIPDDTSLDKLAINDGKLVMVGQSRAAPALVGLLQESPLLREPALSGAVQADPRTGRDRFTMTALIGTAPAAPERPAGSLAIPAPEAQR
jgi:general secretion pathway protein L